VQQLANNTKSLLISYVRVDCEGDDTMPVTVPPSWRFRCPRGRVRDVVTR
jgi:hypothetical protein